jgi:hypothetical protein
MIATAYDDSWLQVDRPRPLLDNKIEGLMQDVVSGKLDRDISDAVYTNFKTEMTTWLAAGELNNITGFNTFNRVDIINGCTQFIDNVYMQGQPQVLIGDYRYHARLGNWWSRPGLLREGVPLIIAMPFPSTGAVHTQMTGILDEARDKGIDVHVDGAWITCCRGIDFDVSHPAIKSVGISLSKGLGLGWNRIGLRWTRQQGADSVTIMNDFNMNLRAPAMIGLHFLRNLEPDYLWNKHGERYYQVCKDFNLTPTNSIYLALKDSEPVGVSPLIRYLENASG